MPAIERVFVCRQCLRPCTLIIDAPSRATPQHCVLGACEPMAEWEIINIEEEADDAKSNSSGV